MRMRVTMTLPGETEAGSAGMQPCRGIAWRAHRDDVRGARKFIFRALPETYRIGRPLCLENPRPEGAEYLLPESAPSPFHAEPTHYHHRRNPGPRTGTGDAQLRNPGGADARRD